MYNNKKSAFSLVELSIVLVILGLLVGGVLSGRSLIRAAEVRKITTEHAQWQTAANSFRQRYSALPGDMHNATQIWGLARTGTGCRDWGNSGYRTGPLDTSGGKATCNGNGNGLMSGGSSSAEGVINNEENIFWLHLVNAGLVTPFNLSYPVSLPGVGPESRVSGSMWKVETDFIDANHIIFYHMRNAGAATVLADYANLTPEEAWSIDSKIDDGMPFMGEVKTVPASIFSIAYLPDCTRTATGGATDVDMSVGFSSIVDATYNLSHSGVACFINLRL